MKFRASEELLQGSSEDEMFENPITKTYDSISSKTVDLILGARLKENLTSLHPSPMHIFRLWQAFLDNVIPLTKIFHAATVQQQVLDAAANLKRISKGLEALMFGIYAMAVTSLTEQECQRILCEGRLVLIDRYQSGARQALINAEYLRSSDLTILQAFTLYLVASTPTRFRPK